MEYIAFSLKYRPKNFDEVVGQKDIVNNLKSAILKKRIHHAYIFSGPRGVGKTSLARIFAKSLNCFNGPTINPCEKCTSCLEITKGTPMDIIEIDAASNRGIDEIRVLRENVKLSPTYSRYKIYIIDEVHMLSQDAFNALLKTLEEPPQHVKFIFATTHIHKVLPTILSRCQKFQFKLLSVEEIVEKLKKIILEEKLDIKENILYAIAKAADGSIRDAESLLDQVVPVLLENQDRDILSFLGLVDEELLNEIAKNIFLKDLPKTLNIIENIIKSGKDLGVFLNNFILYLRNVLFAKLTPDVFKNLQDISKETKDFVFEAASFISVSDILKLIDLLILAKEQSNKLNSIRIPFELAIVKFLYKEEDKPPILNKIEKEEVIKDNIKTELDLDLKDFQKKEDIAEDINQEPNNSNNDNNNDNLILTEIKTKWQEIISNMQKKRMAIASHLSFGVPTSSNGNIINIGFSKKNKFHKEIVENNKNLKFIEESVSKFINKEIYIKFILIDKEDNEEKSKIKEDLQDKEQNADLLNDLLDTFGGNIDMGS